LVSHIKKLVAVRDQASPLNITRMQINKGEPVMVNGLVINVGWKYQYSALLAFHNGNYNGRLRVSFDPRAPIRDSDFLETIASLGRIPNKLNEMSIFGDYEIFFVPLLVSGKIIFDFDGNPTLEVTAIHSPKGTIKPNELMSIYTVYHQEEVVRRDQLLRRNIEGITARNRYFQQNPPEASKVNPAPSQPRRTVAPRPRVSEFDRTNLSEYYGRYEDPRLPPTYEQQAMGRGPLRQMDDKGQQTTPDRAPVQEGSVGSDFYWSRMYEYEPPVEARLRRSRL
jgi:hypothetical protein